MGRYFASLDFGPQLHSIEHMLFAITQRFRANLRKFLDRLIVMLLSRLSRFEGVSYTFYWECLFNSSIRGKFKSIMMVELEKRKQQNKNAKEAKDLMDQLMQMNDEEGKNLTDEEVLYNIVSSIHEENIQLAKEKTDRFITCEDVLKLKYTNKVVEETARLANLSGFVFRKTIEDIDYRGTQLFPPTKGLDHHSMVKYLHVDPKNFENPMAFNPNRWDIRPRWEHTMHLGEVGNHVQETCLFDCNLWEVLNPDVKVHYLSHPLPADGLQLLVSEI
ncbi:hypothetical protein Cgig2_033195 [Carnegiea gigantea]|uniref:Cytochrome P450 n=1 Tax=Carnegiea gigantea TaxID=171969 RepID=A0A9Q1JQY8_9CARY|nr:hypothetical protein Cgig2_033195 [Carnegiea gigantea]